MRNIQSVFRLPNLGRHFFMPKFTTFAERQEKTPFSWR